MAFKCQRCEFTWSHTPQKGPDHQALCYDCADLLWAIDQGEPFDGVDQLEEP
jgi:hypothetical protein